MIERAGHFAGFELTAETNYYPTLADQPWFVVIEGWRFVDAAGHGHFVDRDGSLPTLTADGHLEGKHRYRCRLCDEAIFPDMALAEPPGRPVTTYTFETIAEESGSVWRFTYKVGGGRWPEVLDGWRGVLDGLTGGPGVVRFMKRIES